MFKQIDSVPNLPELEKQVLNYWEKIDPVKILKETRQKTATEKIYYDGPITANNTPHYGNAISWILKDIVPRHWTTQGYYVSRNMGWDCQGIPVEYEVEKALGFEKKEDIEAFGVAKFNDLCRESVFKYRDNIFEKEKAVGRWFDPEDMYYTMDRTYIESMWWALKELYNKGLLYEGHKVVAYSTRAGTTLSSHEVAEGGYKEIEDPFVTVKFPLKDEPNTYVLAWTTTPWTIPGNLLLAVGKKIEYVKVEHNGKTYILAKERLEPVFKDKGDYKVVAELSASDLVGKEYTPPFDYFEHKRSEGCFKIVEAHHTNTEDGTGIVHLAPYGEEDFDVFMSLQIPLFDYLDDTASFTNLIPQYEGKFYKKANPQIIEDLQNRSRLFNTGTLLHRMPMCWRTGTPLIYKPIKSWYIAVTKLKARMLEENQEVNWYPEHLKNGNSGIWINNARDWALSRNRYWGTPIPVWINDKTEEKVIIGSFEELKILSGVEIDDPHKPYVDDVTWEDKVNGGTFRRIKDVADVWFDSAAVPFAKLHYPFENKEELLNKYLPAEYIAEGPDQIRLWFYVMHVLSVALFDKVPYKNVVTSGTLLDRQGKKLSKSKKNYPPMEEVLDTFGGDVLRLFILSSPIVQGESAKFDKEALNDVKKEFFLPLWNSVKYFVTYAQIHNYDPSKATIDSQDQLDQWILARYEDTNAKVQILMDNYRIMEAAKLFAPFVNDLSTWYIRRSREKIKDGNLESLNTLYYVLSNFSRTISAFVPFMAETLYEILDQRTQRNLDSVHLDLYPEIRHLTQEQKELLEKMETTRNIVSIALSLRVSNSLKVRQPLSEMFVESETDFYPELIQDEVNVKEVKKGEPTDLSEIKSVEGKNMKVHLNTFLTEELRSEGIARELVRQLQDLRKAQNLNVTDKVNATFKNTEENIKAVEKFGEEIKSKVLAVELVAGEENSVTILQA